MILEDQPAPNGGSGDVAADLLACDDIEWANWAVSDDSPIACMFDSLRKLEMMSLAVAAGIARKLDVDLRAAVVERREVGIARHLQPLKAGDGRVHLVDAMQEHIDGPLYLRATIMADADAEDGAEDMAGELELADWSELEGDQQVPFVEAAEIVISCVRSGGIDGAELENTIASYLHRMAASASCVFVPAVSY